MYFELNFPIASPIAPQQAQLQISKKGKGKQPAVTSSVSVVYSPAQLAKIESRLDVLTLFGTIKVGYTVIALNQIVESKVDPKTHVNILDPLLAALKKREGVLLLKRLTIALDGESEKGFGLTNANASLFSYYDIIALYCTTSASFSLACLTHTLPSPLTAHIISLPSTSPRLPFNLKHTLIRTAIRNGAVFEICVAGAVSGSSGEGSSSGVDREAEGLRQNWWAAAREVVRVTKGKGLIVSGGAENLGDIRAPRDAENLLCLLGLAQNLAHDAISVTPKALLIRAQTRKTYRAVFSEPRLVLPTKSSNAVDEPPDTVNMATEQKHVSPQPSSEGSSTQQNGRSTTDILASALQSTAETSFISAPSLVSSVNGASHPQTNGKKRTREDSELDGSPLKRLPTPPKPLTPETQPNNESSSVQKDKRKRTQPWEETSDLTLNTKPLANPVLEKSSAVSSARQTLSKSSPQPSTWTESNSAKKRKKKKAKTGTGGETS